MKFLHTADWHVGKTLAGRNRSDEHSAVLSEVVDLARAESVDAVLVAGDLFDSAAPSPAAEDIVYSTLLSLRDAAPVVVVPGNHDSLNRLKAMTPLFGRAGITVRAGLDLHPVRIETGDGPLEVACIPWLSQRFIVKATQLMDLGAKESNDLFRDRMQQLVDAMNARFSGDSVRVLMAHLTVPDAEHGGGERTAQTIFDYWVPTGVFPNTLQYVALGHIHKMQNMPGPAPVWYAGSPLHLDFSDSDDSKSTLMVEVAAGTPAKVRAIELTAGRRLRTIEGTLDQLKALGDQGDDFLRVRVHEQGRTGLGDEVRELFPNAVKVIVESEIDATGRKPGKSRSDASAHELFIDYLKTKRVDDPPLVKLFEEIHEEIDASGTT
ncbi:MAG: metallophosphoesterase family protein [Actinomycetota bacterium]